MAKKDLTNKELEDLKKELREQILNEINDEQKKTNVKPKKTTAKKATVKVEPKKNEVVNEKQTTTISNSSNQSSNLILLFIFLAIVVLIYFLPKIYDLTTKPVKQEEIVEKKKTTKVVKEKVEYKWDDKIIKDLIYPIMRNDLYNTDSYYKYDKVTIANFTNNDILYNAFLDIYSGNISTYYDSYDGQYCSDESHKKNFNAKYITARINNLFNKNTFYTLQDFYVPASSGSEYVGLWKYDSNLDRYVYYGDCNPIVGGNTLYLDILVPNTIKTSSDASTVTLDYSIGFAKIVNNNYEIYSDYNYQNLVNSGTLLTTNFNEELKNIVKTNSLEASLKKYRYIFSKKDCSYGDFCYLSGEWIVK